MTAVPDEEHFRFGENWANFSKWINNESVQSAREDLIRLLGTHELDGKTFFDIGSGSGLHSLAALQCGADRILSIDYDSVSVETTRRVLSEWWSGSNWAAETISIFDARPEVLGEFDVVYSWGVLHHTGDMYRAIRQSTSFVKPGGVFLVALYTKTALCPFWRVEKRFYAKSPVFLQKIMMGLFLLWRAALWVIASAKHLRPVPLWGAGRGMRYLTDVHDWLGGYPYESIAPDELRALMSELGFKEDYARLCRGRRLGLLGSGCDEYRFIKV